MSYSSIKKIRLGKWDKKWSGLVRGRDRTCLYCGTVNSPLNAHHIKGRSCKATRFILENGVSLCVSHHSFNHEFSAHRTPEKFERWFKKEFPERCKAIREAAKRNITEKQAIKEFEELLND